MVPGISSLQLLAARHRIVLNGVGGPIQITTGRRLVEEYDPALGDVVVMLDGDLACAGLVERHPSWRSSGVPSSDSPTRPWSPAGWST